MRVVKVAEVNVKFSSEVSVPLTELLTGVRPLSFIAFVFEEKAKNLTPGFLHLDLTVFPIFQAWPAFQKEQTQNHFFLENNSNCLEKPSIFLESKIVTIQIEETVFVQDNPWFEKPLLEKNCEPPNRTSCHPWPKAGEKQAPSLRRVWCRRLTPRDQSPGRAV